MPVELKSLSLEGYKTYRELKAFEPKRLSVLIGGNGAGKSNLLSFFTLLYRMMADPGELQLAVAEAGGARRLLYDGPKKTESIRARIELQTQAGLSYYMFRLAYAANDSLIFADESWSLHRPGYPAPQTGGGVAGHRESHLKERAFSGEDQLAHSVRSLLRKCVAYQFHDASFTSGMRGKASLSDGRFLRHDGSNIAACLYRLSTGGASERQTLKRIQDSVRQVLPFFAEFVLEPANGHILLQWRERGSDEVFAASQASDGMLRVLALMTLLCQPTETLPAIMMLDEPELGLHPQAIMLLGALIRKASENCQVMVATQSVSLVDEFSLDEIVVLARPGRESTLRRLTEKEYEVWLEEYSTGELWRKNLLEGGPGR
ncbi:MAG: AAA family ATPase [Candidatus Sumerlaeia bacterium]|nr:AAA family ATPase [Candidatus Sumerlaeia bacterium]